jgi:hypothetical protein
MPSTALVMFTWTRLSQDTTLSRHPKDEDEDEDESVNDNVTVDASRNFIAFNLLSEYIILYYMIYYINII